jgi:hypothetical protein
VHPETGIYVVRVSQMMVQANNPGLVAGGIAHEGLHKLQIQLRGAAFARTRGEIPALRLHIRIAEKLGATRQDTQYLRDEILRLQTVFITPM